MCGWILESPFSSFCTFIHHHYEGEIENALLFHSSLKNELFYGLECLVSYYSWVVLAVFT